MLKFRREGAHDGEDMHKRMAFQLSVSVYSPVNMLLIHRKMWWKILAFIAGELVSCGKGVCLQIILPRFRYLATF